MMTSSYGHMPLRYVVLYVALYHTVIPPEGPGCPTRVPARRPLFLGPGERPGASAAAPVTGAGHNRRGDG